MKRRADAAPATTTDVPPFDPEARGPAFLTPEGLLLAATLYAHVQGITPDRYTAGRALADEWIAAHPTSAAADAPPW